MSILEWLGLKAKDEDSSAAGETEGLREIVRELDSMEPAQARYVASFAYLLSRVAYADLDISAEETAEMEQIVRRIGGMDEKQALLVVQMAKTHTRLFGGTENYLVTREFNEMASKEQKHALLRCLFAVSAADDSISAVEDNEIKQIADELKIDRDVVGSLRAGFKDFLASLKD